MRDGSEKRGLERRKTAKNIRKFDHFRKNEKFFEKGVDNRFFDGKVNAVRTQKGRRKKVRRDERRF